MPTHGFADISSPAPTYFIADLHLDPDKTAAYSLALRFFSQIRQADALYILGDLFEYWIGDDAGLPLYTDVIEQLRKISSAGIPVFVMHGNRDFLLGDEFARTTRATVVYADEHIINLDDAPVLLMHGDTLCTSDTQYQTFRRQLRDSHWQHEFLAQSIEQRTAIAQSMRSQSKTHSADKSSAIMDVAASAVNNRLSSSRCATLIHGHTHRPADHVSADGGKRRLVLGDWHEEHALYAVHDHDGLRLTQFNG